MSRNSYPSIDPALNDTLAGAVSFAISKSLQAIDDMLPAKVVAFKPGAPAYVQVQPMIKILTTTNTQISRAQLAEIPVLTMGGNGFVMYFSLKPGDLGYIKANDRDISLYLQYLAESPPNTDRMHSFSDAVFIPAVLTQYTINPEDTGNMILQSLDGTVKISLGTGKIKIAAPTVEIDGLTTVTMTTPLLHVFGNIAATGTITPGA